MSGFHNAPVLWIAFVLVDVVSIAGFIIAPKLAAWYLKSQERYRDSLKHFSVLMATWGTGSASSVAANYRLVFGALVVLTTFVLIRVH